jgi:gluconate 5-dehydrogenase
MRELSGRTALVTGACGGVGRAIARGFAAAGCALIVSDLDADRLDALAAELRDEGTDVRIEVADLAIRDACHALGERCRDADILINNAALTHMTIQSVMVRDDAFWDRTFAIDLFAPIALMQALVPHMTARGHGAVINISSINAARGTVDNAPYAAAKAALEMASRVTAMELAMRRTGVRVNCIAPGFVRTPALARHFPDAVALDAAARAAIPLGRVIEPGEIADLCVYLASDRASALLGTVVTVDGGMTAGAYARADSAGQRDD